MIGKLEQACIFDGQIVCSDCDQKLRKGSKDSILKELPVAREFAKSGRVIDQKSRKGGTVAIIVALILIFIVFYAFCRPRYVPVMQFDGSRYVGYKYITVNGLQSTTDWLSMFAFIGPSLLLIARSFVPRLGLWRGVLTWVGGLMVSLAVCTFLIALIVGIHATGAIPTVSSTWIGLMMAMALFLIPGIIMLKFGFSPKGFERARREQKIRAQEQKGKQA